MDDDERVVRDAWDTVGDGVAGGVGDADVIEDVIARHREAHRRYHTLAHVAWVLRTADDLIAAEPDSGVDADAVRVAAIFHDVVYDTRSADNELRSADLAAKATGCLGWTSACSALVSRLILATAIHEPSDVHEAVLVDADLSILGTDEPTYTRYVAGVRAEYAHVDDDAWRSGRALVLRRFLDRPHVYATTVMRVRAENQARLNLATELAVLGS